MRIGIDYRLALIRAEGIPRYERELVRALATQGRGHRIRLFAFTRGRAELAREELGIRGTDARLLRMRLPNSWTPSLLRYARRGVDDLLGGVDVFHHPGYLHLDVRRAVQIATIMDCFYMYDDLWVTPEANEQMTRAALRLVERVDHVIVPSEYSRREAIDRLGVDPASVTVVPLGVDHVLPAIAAANHLPPGDSPFVLTVSRVDARKNHTGALRAFEKMVREGLPHRWVIVGPAGYRSEEFERALADSPASDRVEWRREVADGELFSLYKSAELFLFPSFAEGFGFPPLEAMAAGTPVVSSGTTSLAEVCGDAACYADPTDPDEIFERARELLRDPDLRTEMVRRGRENAGRFTWQETAERTCAVYEKALADAPAPKRADSPDRRRGRL